MMSDFKIAYNADGSFQLVEFPDPLLDDGREVVTIRATFRIDGEQKCYIHLPVTRRTLGEHALELQAELERQAQWFSEHPDRLQGDAPVIIYP